jgi:hypothetical protein
MLFDEEVTESSDEEEHEAKLAKIRKKRHAKRKIPKLKNEVIVIKNQDKDKGNWMESWSKPKNRSPGCIPHPFRMLALGGVGRGKTNSLKNIFLQHQGSGRPFKRLIVVCCDTSSAEWLDCDPESVRTILPDSAEFDGSEKTCLVIDDYEFAGQRKEAKANLATLFRFCSSHKNLSILSSYQSFFDVDNIIRKTSNVFMIYKPTAKNELTTIGNRVGLSKNKLQNLFETECSDTYDHVMIDHTIGTKYPLRKNIFTPLDQSDSD